MLFLKVCVKLGIIIVKVIDRYISRYSLIPHQINNLNNKLINKTTTLTKVIPLIYH